MAVPHLFVEIFHHRPGVGQEFLVPGQHLVEPGATQGGVDVQPSGGVEAGAQATLPGAGQAFVHQVAGMFALFDQLAAGPAQQGGRRMEVCGHEVCLHSQVWNRV